MSENVKETVLIVLSITLGAVLVFLAAPHILFAFDHYVRWACGYWGECN
jgi:hypothetical protein